MLKKIYILASTHGITGAIRIVVNLAFWKVYNLALLRIMGTKVGKGTIFEGAVQVHGGNRVRIGNQVRLGAGVIVDAGVGGEVVIGSRTYVGRFATIISNDKVEIGEKCLISPFCYIIDSDHGFRDEAPIQSQGYVISRVMIGDDVWIGVGSAILRGVTIGTGSVIGARSVVTRDIPRSVIAVGSPARVIKERSPAS